MDHSISARSLQALEVPPQSITSGAAINGTGVDMQGWSGVAFTIQIGTITGAGTLAARLEESDTSTTANMTNITNAALVNVTNTTPNNVMVLEVWRPTKRYVRCVVTQAANTVVASVISTRFRRSGLLPPTQVASQRVVVQAN
jgi:hypothetical protein